MNLELSRRHIELRAPAGAIHKRIQLDGIKYDAGGVRFESGLYTINQAAILSAALIGESASIELRTPRSKRGGYQATSKDLEIINSKHAEQERALEDFHIYQRVPVNNVPSRTIGIRFTDAVLDKFVLDATEGRARLRGHNKADIVGRTFAAEVVEETVRGIDGKWLLTTEFISRRTIDGEPMNSELITKHVNGELAFDSIGFYPGSKVEFKEFEAGNQRLSIIEIDYDPTEQHPVEMREVSFVHLGELKAVGSRMQSQSGDDDYPDSLFVHNYNPSVEVSRHKKGVSTWVKSL